MSGTLISGRLPPDIDQTKSRLAYGDRALPILNEGLQDCELVPKQRALRTLCDYLHDSEHVATALKQGIHLTLRCMLRDHDITIRNKATEALYIISCHCVGRDAIINADIIPVLSKLFNDKEDIVRRNTHLCLEMLSVMQYGATGLINFKLVPKYVEKLKTEHVEIKSIILDTLHNIMVVETTDALENDAMSVLNDLLSNESCEIRSKAARDMFDLCFTLKGKETALEVGCLGSLMTLLTDENSEVRAKAAGTLAMITITTAGKYAVLNLEAVDPLIDGVNDEFSEVRLNSIKTLTNLSETPEGRKMLIERVLDSLQMRLEDDSAAVRKASKGAIKVITWLP